MTPEQYATRVRAALESLVLQVFSSGLPAEELLARDEPGADPHDPETCALARWVLRRTPPIRPGGSVRSVLFTYDRALVTGDSYRPGPDGRPRPVRASVMYPECVAEAVRRLADYDRHHKPQMAHKKKEAA